MFIPGAAASVAAPQFVFLEAEAKRLGITVAELIRRIIDERREAQE